MKCPVCGHAPHGGWDCEIPVGLDQMDICECPFQKEEER